jgi:hypothetical protein
MVLMQLIRRHESRRKLRLTVVMALTSISFVYLSDKAKIREECYAAVMPIRTLSTLIMRID